MANPTKLTIEIDDQLTKELTGAAEARGIAPARLAADCVAQHFEISSRFLALLECSEQIDTNLAMIAQFVGDATAPAEGVDLWKICKYRREKEGR